jgi:hypothetical protein
MGRRQKKVDTPGTPTDFWYVEKQNAQKTVIRLVGSNRTEWETLERPQPGVRKVSRVRLAIDKLWPSGLLTSTLLGMLWPRLWQP